MPLVPLGDKFSKDQNTKKNTEEFNFSSRYFGTDVLVADFKFGKKDKALVHTPYPDMPLKDWSKKRLRKLEIK